MPAKDIYHETLVNALKKQEWNITHDPFKLKWGKRGLYIDIGAEKILAAEKGENKIAVEIKSFVGNSIIGDLEQALGQFVLYRNILAQTEPDRKLFLAVRKPVYEELFQVPVGKILCENEKIKLIVFEPKSEEIIQWIL